MGTFHEEPARAGVLLDVSGLQPSRSGWRIHCGAGGWRVVDGPFTEAKELFAGCTLLSARSRDEALQWSHRFANPVGAGRGAAVEVRQLHELDDFEPGPTLDRIRPTTLPRHCLEDTP